MTTTQTIKGSAIGSELLERTSLKVLWKLSFPLMLSMLSTSMLNFCDRLFLAHYSLHSLEACTTAGELCSFFQLPLIFLIATVQVFIGQCLGSHQAKKTGNYIWQMIWISLLSMLITIPTCRFAASQMFEGSSLQVQASTYFYCLSAVNFLFPIGAALSAFFIGIGKTKITIFATVCAHIVNVSLDSILIFGIGPENAPLLKPMGILGSAIATSTSQIIYCSIFFILFIKKTRHDQYGTRDKYFDPAKLKTFFKLAIPSAVGKVMLMLAWIVLTRFIILKGGDYLLVNAVGMSLLTIFTCFQDGLSQAALCQSSYLVGAQKKQLLWGLLKTTVLFHIIMQAIFALPLIIFSHAFLGFFLKEPVEMEMLQKTCYWMWIFLLFEGINLTSQSFLTSLKDTTFIMIIKVVTVWITAIIPTWYAMFVWDLPAQYLWALAAMDCFIAAGIFLWRTAIKIPNVNILVQKTN
ncbi:MAG: MATE family efflux transporter [Parachlamydiales bacterium]|nr:MATE family efflux transporter [Parachlamydiales bacterium]